jgi:putative MATE family efflux protein
VSAAPDQIQSPPISAVAPPARPLSLRFLAFLGPLILSNVVQVLSGTLSNIYLGQLLGLQAMAAAASVFPVLMVFIAFFIGLGAGATVLVGQAWGARDEAKLRRIAGSVLLFGVLLAIALAVLGVLVIGPLLRRMGTPGDILPQATLYAQVMLAGLPIPFAYMLIGSILRGTGDSVTPLRALLVSVGASMLLTPALILGWLGLPALGVLGAAVANVIAPAMALSWLIWFQGRRLHLVSWRSLRGHFHFDGPLLKAVVRLGIPSGLFAITSSLADVALLSLVNQHGSQATAAWGAVSQVMTYVMFPAMSIAITSSVFAAQAIGAGQLHEVDHVTRVGLWMNLLLTGALAVLVALLAPWAVALFLKDAAVVAFAASLLRITAWGAIAFGMASVFTGVMRAAGTVRVPTMISLGCILFLVFPVAWALQEAIGVKGIWASYPVTYGCALVLQAAYFFGVWKRQPLRKLV